MRAVASARLSTPGGRIFSIRLVQSAPGSAVCGGVYFRICADAREALIAPSSTTVATPEQASIAITANFLTLTAHLPVRKTRDSAGGEKVAHSAASINLCSCNGTLPLRSSKRTPHRETRAESRLDGSRCAEAARGIEAFRVRIADDVQDARGTSARDIGAMFDQQ